MIDVYAVVDWAKLCGIYCFRREYPIGARICHIEFFKDLRDSKIPKLKLYRARLSRLHLVLRERRKNVTLVDILMRVSVDVNVMNCLE